ncbi:MAG TPA: YqhA family protein [Anaerolineae bacterium]|nr:YqhA family protein [Anaerolineae bacterium]
MSRFFAATRYLIIIPIIGLGFAAAAFFLFGGVGLIRFLVEAIGEALGLIHLEAHEEEIPFVIEVVEFVHTFLIGTVLYITSIGFYQLFIAEIQFPGWLKIHNTEELETNLIGVTVVVLAVNFLSVVFTGENVDLIAQGAGIALPIGALGIFVGLRAWAARQSQLAEKENAVSSDISEKAE